MLMCVQDCSVCVRVYRIVAINQSTLLVLPLREGVGNNKHPQMKALISYTS